MEKRNLPRELTKTPRESTKTPKNPTKDKDPIMDIPPKIQIFTGCRPYLRWLNAFNRENFHQTNRISNIHSVFSAFLATLAIILISTHFSFDFWFMIDCRKDLNKLVATFPIVVSTLQIWVSCIVMVVKNRTITTMINRLQSVVDQRKLLFHRMHSIR